MEGMIWFPIEDGYCPLSTLDNKSCTGTCVFFCQFKGNLVGSEEPPEFECMIRLTFLKYLGVVNDGDPS